MSSFVTWCVELPIHHHLLDERRLAHRIRWPIVRVRLGKPSLERCVGFPDRHVFSQSIAEGEMVPPEPPVERHEIEMMRAERFRAKHEQLAIRDALRAAVL